MKQKKAKLQRMKYVRATRTNVNRIWSSRRWQLLWNISKVCNLVKGVYQYFIFFFFFFFFFWHSQKPSMEKTNCKVSQMEWHHLDIGWHICSTLVSVQLLKMHSEIIEYGICMTVWFSVQLFKVCICEPGPQTFSQFYRRVDKTWKYLAHMTPCK